MRVNSSATVSGRQPIPGLVWGILGVAAFSLTLPTTRIAVAAGMPPWFTGLGRAVVAAVLAGLLLAATRQPLPTRRQWPRIAVVALGVVVGFPVLSTLALQTVPAGHGAVVTACLPAATAAATVLRTGERQPRLFWAAALLGTLAAAGAAVLQGGAGGLHAADLLLLGSVAAGACGYAEGGMLSRELGAWQTIC